MLYSMAENWPNWLKKLMASKNLNNKGLAALLKVSPSTVGNWRDGGKPDADNLAHLAELAGGEVSGGQLFEMVYGGRAGPEIPNQVIEDINRIVADMPPHQQRAALEILASYKASLRGANGQGSS